jgi:hypothetical protein
MIGFQWNQSDAESCSIPFVAMDYAKQFLFLVGCEVVPHLKPAFGSFRLATGRTNMSTLISININLLV